MKSKVCQNEQRENQILDLLLQFGELSVEELSENYQPQLQASAGIWLPCVNLIILKGRMGVLRWQVSWIICLNGLTDYG